MLLPRWGDRPLQEDITRSGIHELLDTLVQAKKIGASRETRKHVRALFNWAVEREILQASPAQAQRACLSGRSCRVLDDQELRAIWACAKAMGYACGPLFQLLVLTG